MTGPVAATVMEPLGWVPAVEKSWAGYIDLYNEAFGRERCKAEERRWYRELALEAPQLLEHLLVAEAGARLQASLATLAYRDKQAAWYEEQRRVARNALKLRLRANVGADATTGRNYKIWRRHQEGGVAHEALAKEFGISTSRVGQILTRQRRLAPLRQQIIWQESRQNLGRPIDLDEGEEDYRGKWLP